MCSPGMSLGRNFLTLFMSFQEVYLAVLTALPGVAGEYAPAAHLFAQLDESHCSLPHP